MYGCWIEDNGRPVCGRYVSIPSFFLRPPTGSWAFFAHLCWAESSVQGRASLRSRARPLFCLDCSRISIEVKHPVNGSFQRSKREGVYELSFLVKCVRTISIKTASCSTMNLNPAIPPYSDNPGSLTKLDYTGHKNAQLHPPCCSSPLRSVLPWQSFHGKRSPFRF